MLHLALSRRAMFWLSLVAGAVLWEAVGHAMPTAFMVPLSATLARLWELDDRWARCWPNLQTPPPCSLPAL